MKQTAPLSKIQYGLYVECVHHAGEPWYNRPRVYVLDGSIDSERLCRAVETAFRAHPTLFTRFGQDEEGEPVQTIDMERETFSLVTEDVPDGTVDPSRPELFIEPFNLDGDRMFHIRLMRDREHYYLFLDIHHLIADGTSHNVLVSDINKAYRNEAIGVEERTMGEVAADEAQQRRSPDFEAAKEWYARNFDCADTFTQLIPDREETPSDSRNMLRRTLGTDMARIEAFCRENGVFKSTFFTSAYACLLAKYNNEQESLFTTVYNGRTDKRLSRTVGMFVKTLPVYAKFGADTTVLEYLRAGQEQMGGCRRHEVYAFTDMMNDLRLQSNSMFAWHASLFSDYRMDGKPMQFFLANITLQASLYVKAFIVDDKIQVEAEYKDSEYSPELIANFLESYEAVVEGFLTRHYLHDINLCAAAQLELLDSFNRTDTDYDASQTIVSLFRRQAQVTPQNTAVVFGDKQYTYTEVDELSDRIAACIAGKGLAVEDVVSVLIPRCEWMAIASLGVLKAGCAYQPLDPTYPKERLNFMMQDAGAKLLIADEKLRGIVDEYTGEVLLMKELAELPAGMVPANGITPGGLFILLYTSGSTGIPKGCELTHGNLVAFCHWYQRYYGLQPQHNVAAYASYGFDACMMDMYPALTCGAATHIIPEEIRLDLVALNDYFEQNRITHSFMTTQVGYQFAAYLQNNSLKHLSIGGEKLPSMAPPQGYAFYNVYGPTECTIFTTAYPLDKKMKEIPIGKPLDNMRLYIVDTRGHRQPVGAAGELWIAGPQVSRGYLNRPEKTAEVYIGNPFTDEEKYARIYRTGDIVRYLPDGNIQFVGRRDGMVKIRGFRIELKEVESIIRQFPGVEDATVQAVGEEGREKSIVAYITGKQPVDIEALHRFILEEKPPYMVPAVTMQIDAIPLNQNGKVNRKALPVPEFRSEEDFEQPGNPLEEEIAGIIAGIIGHSSFGVTTNLLRVGLTSLLTMQLVATVSKRKHIRISAKTIMAAPTVRDLAKAIAASATDAGNEAKVTPATRRRYYPLSENQRGIFIDWERNRDAIQYNIPQAVKLGREVDIERLKSALNQTVKAHPAFFTGFVTRNGDVMQERILPHDIDIAEIACDHAPSDAELQAWVRPFDLCADPLFRISILRYGSDAWLLMDFHHIIFDGVSAMVFMNTLQRAYAGETPEEEQYTAFDRVLDEIALMESDEAAAAEEWFDRLLTGFETTVYPRSASPEEVKPGTMMRVSETIDGAAINSFCSRNALTPSNYFLSAFLQCLHRLTRSDKVAITSINNGRDDARLIDDVGMFVKTLPVVSEIPVSLARKSSPAAIAEALQQQFNTTRGYDFYPFTKIVGKYDIRPEIMYVYEGGVSLGLAEGNLSGEKIRLGLDTAKVPLTLMILTPSPDKYQLVVEFDASLYAAKEMMVLADIIKTLVVSLTVAPTLTDATMLSESQDKILGNMREGLKGEVGFASYPAALEMQVDNTPDKTALIACDAVLSFSQFDRETNKLANALMKLGIGRGDRVVVLLPRDSRLIIAIYGIMKTGAAYVPCDPDYPVERVRLITEDSDAKAIVTIKCRLDSFAGKALDIDTLLSEKDEKRPEVSIMPDDPAYLIYTSGSTGRPKGVVIHHEAIANYLYAYREQIYRPMKEKEPEVNMLIVTISFDASQVDLGTSLTSGHTLALANEEECKDAKLLAALMTTHHVEAFDATPSRLTVMLELPAFREAISRCRLLNIGGEGFPPSLLEKLDKAGFRGMTVNEYGPTETTVGSNHAVLKTGSPITAGRPFYNYKEYIVDTWGGELPAGVIGELFIAGRGVGKGYHNLPEKTDEVFVTYNNEKAYKTGDLARWTPEGDVVILGRTDHQIKLRGLRIEPGEIESVIRKVGGVKNAVVVIRKINGKEHLCAYYTADREITPDALKAEISKSLTQYMVPTAYFQLEEMPMTPNGKTDIKALPEPQLAVSTAYEVPADDMERLFCRIFAEVLQMDKVGATDNFFELGGTSLIVTRVIVEADKAGVRVTYGDVFAHPTPRKLAAFLTGRIGNTGPVGKKKYDYTTIDHLLQKNTLDAFRKEGLRQPGNVLLTGATGYLGIHILRELIDSDAGQIYCLVRGKSAEAAEQRLKSLLFYYFSDAFDALFGKRLHIVLGDVTSEFDRNIEADTVFNCAAVVKHFSEGTEIEDVNVGSAKRCVEFCLKKGARLIHVSTLSTRGLSVNGMPAPGELFTEQRLYMGQYLDNQYIHSKFLSERVVLEAAGLHGLDAKVMRVGNLAARSTDGEFQANFTTNSFMGRIRVYNMLGCCPYSMRNKRVEFSPIDEVARAIVLLSATPKECTVFHPYNIYTRFLGDVLKGLSFVGGGIRFVEEEDFQKAMEEAGSDPEKVKKMTGLLAYKDMAHGQKNRNVAYDNEYTMQVLYRLGFEWSPTSRGYVERMLVAINGLGFFD